MIEREVKQIEYGKYSFKYTPTSEGKHEFSVVVKNSGSPDCEAVYSTNAFEPVIEYEDI